MAYVVRRRDGRFEIRESVHTPRGPRARTLANFRRLTEETLTAAAGRARRPFDAEAVAMSARRAGIPLNSLPMTPERSSNRSEEGQDTRYRRFVDASRRMAHDLGPSGPPTTDDPGRALIELLGFAEQVRRSQPPRPLEALAFPPLVHRQDTRNASPPPARRG